MRRRHALEREVGDDDGSDREHRDENQIAPRGGSDRIHGEAIGFLRRELMDGSAESVGSGLGPGAVSGRLTYETFV
jgi:hypothetical protein